MNDHPMTDRELADDAVSKVPAITLGFWIIKILATTLGETGGDSVTMSWLGETTANPVPNGYLIGTAIFGVVLLGLVWAQIRARDFNPWLYWATIVASTTAGTTLADFATRSLGIGYPGGSILLLSLVLISLFTWHRSLGTIDVNTVATAKAETFYWVTITFSQTLGTALGDWIADAGLGYSGGALVFGAGLAILAALYFWSKTNHVFLFWAAFILTRPLGATVGDWLDKPLAKGGLAFSRPLASAVLAVVIFGLILLLPQRPGRHPGRAEFDGVRGRLSGLVCAGLAAALCPAEPAKAGPPYETDDPEPTETGRWEIYAFTGFDADHGNIDGTTGVDLNYGPVKDVQLTATLPLDYSRPQGGGWRSGTGDVEVGVKYRFVDVKAEGVSIAVFPRVFLPTSQASTRTRLLLPVWVQKDVGKTSIFGGGGYDINPGPGNRDFWLAGAADHSCLQRQGHARRGSNAPGRRRDRRCQLE